MSGVTRLTLNVVPVGFHGESTLTVGRVPYTTSEALDDLREQHRGVFLVRREGADKVVLVARTADAEPPGQRATPKAGDVPHLVAGLVREWTIDYLLGLGRQVAIAGQQLVVLSNRPEDDLLHTSCPHGVKLPAWIGTRVVYEFDDRVMPRGDGGRDVVLACDVHSRTILNATVTELLDLGVDVVGRFAQVERERNDGRLLPRRELRGQVLSVGDGVLRVEGAGDSVEEIPIDAAFLEPRIENFERVITTIEPRFKDDILEGLARRKATLASGPDRLSRTQKMFDFLAKQHPEVAPGLRIDFGGMHTAKRDRFPPHEVVAKPGLIFDVRGPKTKSWAQGGLDEFGPYDRYTFSPKNLNIVVICQAAKQGRVEEFIHRLLHGNSTEPGFLRRFALEKPFVKVFTTPRATGADYRRACAESWAWIQEKGKRWNLAYVQIDEGMDQLNGDQNPYLVTKAFFLSHGVGVQSVELETMEQDAYQLAYTLNNVGLASYAKLGGIPWLLPAGQQVAHELVLGLGSYQANSSRMGGRERYVGITTVFTGDGRYRVESRTPAVPFAEYRDEMLAALRRVVDDARTADNWGEHDPVRLVFHAFKPMKNAEVEAVKALMAELGLPHAKFAFLHIADNHPFLVFDEAQEGAKAPRGTKKGVFAAPRGLAVPLSGSEVLLALTGPKDVKKASDGLPRPVLMKLHRESTFRDQVYLARQAFAFACHSWQSFFPSSMPITIGYSQMVAKRLRLLADVPGWSPDDILTPIGRTRWFL